MPVTHLSGVRIAYDDKGSGDPALLFLPGWLAPRWVFADVMAQCEGRVLAVDWRGHGESEIPENDFAVRDLAEDALAVIEASAANSVLPVASAHSGWVAIELRRRLGARVPAIVSLEWFMRGLPPQLNEALQGMQDPARWRQTVDAMHARWRGNSQNEKIRRLIDIGTSADFSMWSRSGREVSAAFARERVPFEVLRTLEIPVLHLYSQALDEAYDAAQQELARANPWFSTYRLSSSTQFSMLEVPLEISRNLKTFLQRLS